MAQHIYMSIAPFLHSKVEKEADVREGRITQEQFDQWLNNQLFNYRGEAQPGDDPQGFTRRMGNTGHEVIVKPTQPEGNGKRAKRGDLV